MQSSKSSYLFSNQQMIKVEQDKHDMKKKNDSYLGIETHCILGRFVEFRIFQHVFFPTRSLKYPKSEGGQSREDLRKETQRHIGADVNTALLMNCSRCTDVTALQTKLKVTESTLQIKKKHN